MGITQKILGSLVDFGEKPKEAPEAEEAPVVKQNGKSAKPAVVSVIGSVVSTGPVDEEYVRALTALVEKSTLAGYNEFVGQLEVLAGDIPDETRLFGAALKSAARAHPGLDRAAVLAAIADRLRLLDVTAEQFTAETDTAEKQKIGGAESDLAAVEAQIEELTKSRDAMRLELASNKSKFEVKRAKFATAYQAVRAKLADLQMKTANLLKG